METDMAMSIKPLHDRVLVKRLENEEVTAGGIIIPDSAKEKPQMGKVVAAGEGKVLADGGVRSLQVKAGDQVVFGKYSGTEFSFAGEDFLILREEELLGVVQK